MIAQTRPVGLITPIELPGAGPAGEGAPWLLVDTRSPTTYLERHMPHAINLYAGMFLDPFGGPVLDGKTIADRIGHAGIARDSRLLLYDDGAGAHTGGILWLLDRVTHPSLALRDGGISAWYAQGGQLDGDVAERAAATYIVVPNTQIASDFAGLVARLCVA